ncbi:MAG: replication-associated recombination protein A [Bacilli bacterium]|nr:replication-associated recombination protein A [Bacilli bacterium]
MNNKELSKVLSKTLFDDYNLEPLASRMRPEDLDEFVGQNHLIGEGKILRKIIQSDNIPSMIFWGPPGVGKTTLARIIANKTKSKFVNFSAVTSGIKEIKKVMQDAEESKHIGIKTILFVDEIHRFNKAQQDAFLPYVEKGSIILIGATTENPSFEVNNALLSRCRVFVLKELSSDDIYKLLYRAIHDKKGYGNDKINITDEELMIIAKFANGDARSALSTLDMVISNGEIASDGIVNISKEIIEDCLSKKTFLYDKDGEEHYNLISALHKSMRNSDPDAAVYWLARMLEAGEDPIYIARRVTRFASEDIGLADTNALNVAINVYQACHLIGMPECSVHLTEAVIYMSLAPKSNSSDVAYIMASEDAKRMLAEPVPLIIRNAPTKLMKDLDYGKGYQYAHDTKEKVTTMECLPPSLIGKEYYIPNTLGNEIKFKERLEVIKKWKAEHKKK